MPRKPHLMLHLVQCPISLRVVERGQISDPKTLMPRWDVSRVDRSEGTRVDSRGWYLTNRRLLLLLLHLLLLLLHLLLMLLHVHLHLHLLLLRGRHL